MLWAPERVTKESLAKIKATHYNKGVNYHTFISLSRRKIHEKAEQNHSDRHIYTAE
jgi:predicted DNA binding CopG/RHH family protein